MRCALAVLLAISSVRPLAAEGKTACVLEGPFVIELLAGGRPAPDGRTFTGRLSLALEELPPACLDPRQPVLEVIVVPPAEVSLDTQLVGEVASARLPAREGPHTLLIVHRDYQALRRHVTLIPGQTLRVVIDLAEDGVRRKRAQ